MVQNDFSIVGEFRPNQTDEGSLFVARFEEATGPQYCVSSDMLFPERSVLGTLAHTGTSPGDIALTSLDLAPRLLTPTGSLIESALGITYRRVAGALISTVIAQNPRLEAVAILNEQPPRMATELTRIGFCDREPQIALTRRAIAELLFLGPNLAKIS